MPATSTERSAILMTGENITVLPLDKYFDRQPKGNMHAQNE